MPTDRTIALPRGESMAAGVDGLETLPVVLLLHGIPGSRETWRNVIPLLTRDYRVVAPDLLGFGRSSSPLRHTHAPEQAEAVLAALDTFDIAACHVVGFDFGGPIALSLYRRAPERFLSLTLAAANAFTDTPIPGPLKLARVPILGDALFAAMCSPPGLAAMWWGASRDKRHYPWREFRATLPSRRARQATRRTFVDSLRHLRARYAAIEQTLPLVSCPAAVLWGDSDPFFGVETGRRTARAMRGARFELLAGCGHFIPQERPAAIAEAVNQLASSTSSISRSMRVCHGPRAV